MTTFRSRQEMDRNARIWLAILLPLVLATVTIGGQLLFWYVRQYGW
jgi:hypothetical protein